jgi:hypothetical protein
MNHNDPRSYYEKLARSQAVGATPWSKIGFNGDVGTSYETLWTVGGIYVYPTTGIPMEVVSTGGGAGNDVAAGTGVQQVQITYLTTAFVSLSEIVTMTGGVAAPTVANNIYRVQSFRAYRCGTTIPAGAAGVISLRAVGGAVTYSQIAVGQTRARNITYTVPAAKILYISSIVLSTGASAASKAVTFTTRATYDDALGGRVLPANFFMPYTEVQLQDNSFYRALETPTRFPTGVDIKVDSVSDSAGAVCSCALRGFLLNTNV